MDEITRRLNKLHRREFRDKTTQAAIEAMRENLDKQDDPLVGSFWYDPEEDELFGVSSTNAEDVQYRFSAQFGGYIRTSTRLHQTIWQKEYHRGKDKRFTGDYTKVPRGRVFEFKDKGFIVYTGQWIKQYPQVMDMILEEFQLPENTVFKRDSHWDIGHGWSDEF